MIKITLILLLIHYIALYIFKPKMNTLSCGLFGWAGNSVKLFNKDKFDKLGILNVERGRSSCGISLDGDIQIGIDSEKLYYDFIIERKIKPERFPIVIGHTRQSSVGLVNVYNAHPFGFGDNNNDFIFIGAHNGTLKNHKELAIKYEIEQSVENSYYDKFDKEVIVKRDKIDSEILLEIIYSHKNFKVLSEYIGGAALVFTDTTVPNVLYLFKGKSKDYKSSLHETTERPLFVYVENKNSMYFSSLEDSLKTIGGNDNNIIDIESNVIYKITNGDFKKAELINISRVNATQNISHLHNNRQYYEANYYTDKCEYQYQGETYDYNDNILTKKKIIGEGVNENQINLPLVIKEKEEDNIYNEKLLKVQSEYKAIPYFNKLRWYRNGQLLNGIFVWIENYGYYFLSYTKTASEIAFNNILDKVFDGKSFYDEKTCISGKIPFKSSKNMIPYLFYFVEGVQIKTYLDYSCFYTRHTDLKKGEFIDYKDLSMVSTHPVIDLYFKYKEENIQCIVKDQVIYNGSFTMLGSEKIYHIDKGNLKSVVKTDYFSNYDENYYEIEKSKELKVCQENNFLNSLENTEVVIIEQNDDELLAEMLEQEEEINQLIRDVCDEDFTEPIKDFQNIKNKLFKYSDNNLAIKVISFIDNSMRDIKSFIN